MRLAAAVMVLALFLRPAVAVAGQFEDAKAAAARGDYQAALKIWQPLAERGHARAQYDLGVMYDHGWGVGQDYGEAMEWYRKSAEQHYPEAQFAVGRYYSPKSFHMDEAEAAKWFRMAAEQGYAEAEGALGFRYERGEGVKMDCSEAVKWDTKAADQGDPLAEYSLGNLYDHGKCVPQDYSKAEKLYRASAEQKNSTWSEFNYLPLEKLYANGFGVKQDWKEAYFWGYLSITVPYSEYDVKLTIETSRHLTPEQIEQVKKRAADWKPKPSKVQSCHESEDCTAFCKGSGIGTECMPDGRPICNNSSCDCELACSCDATCL